MSRIASASEKERAQSLIRLGRLDGSELSVIEPTRVFRRQFILSHATLADSSNWR